MRDGRPPTANLFWGITIGVVVVATLLGFHTHRNDTAFVVGVLVAALVIFATVLLIVSSVRSGRRRRDPGRRRGR